MLFKTGKNTFFSLLTKGKKNKLLKNIENYKNISGNKFKKCGQFDK